MPRMDTLQQLEVIDRMSYTELDALPFGAIRLDKAGYVLNYNAAESKLTGREAKRVVGRHFFADVAPCTNVQAFAGRFREGVARGDMHVDFPYRFELDTSPRDVAVTLFYSKQTDTAWVFLREAAP
jgi:photoactive yellow protein